MTTLARPTSLEIVHSDYPRGPFRCAVFDFDGTLSLLRGNWQGLMIPMMVETLAASRTGEPLSALTNLVEEFVTRLTGQPTMQQILALAEEVAKRGGSPIDPEAYLTSYLDRLLSRTSQRIDAVEAGRVTPDEMLIAGSRQLLESLSRRGIMLAIASGTELSHVQSESRVLQIDHYFGGRIFGPMNNDAGFSKLRTLRKLKEEHDLRGDEIVVIGDGPAEMEAAKAIRALAVGVASDEVYQGGRVNELKRQHLLRSGADVIVPDYRDLTSILRLLGFEVRALGSGPQP
jgi:phosphoglycolate phosphatase-like HAD superfamily hydrolase